MIPLFAVRHGELVEAVVSPVGASLRRLAVNGIELIRNTLDEVPVHAAGVVLVPWPNRVADARWTYRGAVQQLEVTEPELGHALHGLLTHRRYTVTSRSTGCVELAASVEAAPGYPFHLDTSVAYQLTAGGITVTHRVTNRGLPPAPVALGAHPYLRLGNRPLGSLVFTTAARRVVTLDERHLPNGSFPVDGTPFDLREGQTVSDLPPHAVYTDFIRHRGGFAHTLADPASGAAVVLDAGCDFEWLQVYVSDEFPGAPAGEPAIAVEPMTAPPNALNSGEGVRWLGEGWTWETRWGIRLQDPPAGSAVRR
jgi:aldose 1-epimerase